MLNTGLNIFVVSFCILVLHKTSDSLPHGEFRMRIASKQSQADTLSLPSNATSIRDEITDNFSCENKTYGYYADVDNDCQIFHVCLPVTYADGRNQTFRWSFICPESTVFSQENFVCVREEDLTIRCEDSADFYELNDSFGDKEEEEEPAISEDDKNNEASNPEEMNSMMNGDGMEEEMMSNKKRKKPIKMESKKKILIENIHH